MAAAERRGSAAVAVEVEVEGVGEQPVRTCRR